MGIDHPRIRSVKATLEAIAELFGLLLDALLHIVELAVDVLNENVR
jgi:hypothetical protein